MKRLQFDEAQIRDLIEVQKLQQWKVAEILGCSRGTIENRVRELGIETQRTGPRSGEGHTNWRGGRKLVGGYWYIYRPEHPFATKSKYVLEHRLVMEAKLQRFLLPGEVVHHRDGNPQNNAPENLEAFQTNAAHLRQELTGRIPQWTPEGRARTIEGVKQAAIRRRKERGDSPHTRTNRRKKSTADK
jgi:hypothetical protein